ncbi:MAG: hypothetical protein JXA97_04590 [Anaerolineales bacterium]|nr:hypothetical protein [Anaerolineales bacterium]
MLRRRLFLIFLFCLSIPFVSSCDRELELPAINLQVYHDELPEGCYVWALDLYIRSAIMTGNGTFEIPWEDQAEWDYDSIRVYVEADWDEDRQFPYDDPFSILVTPGPLINDGAIFFACAIIHDQDNSIYSYDCGNTWGQYIERALTRSIIHLQSGFRDVDDDWFPPEVDGIETLVFDCDDDNEYVLPYTRDRCDDEIDNNCNESINEGCYTGEDPAIHRVPVDWPAPIQIPATLPDNIMRWDPE